MSDLLARAFDRMLLLAVLRGITPGCSAGRVMVLVKAVS